MKRLHSSLPILAFLVALSCVSLRAETAPQSQTAALPTFSFGGDLRLRNEYFDNALALNDQAALHDQDFFRTRLRLWGSVSPVEDLALNARLAAEPRTWMRPSFAKQYTGLGTEGRYVLFDALNAKWTNSSSENLVTVTVGRQDVQFGDTLDWWLVADGTPGDGSWTSYFDAARLSVENKRTKARFDLVALSQRAMPGSALPILGAEKTYTLSEQNEQGVVAYLSLVPATDHRVDGYFIYKGDKAAVSAGDTGDIYTVGGKWSGRASPSLTYGLEGAYQWGGKSDPTVRPARSGRRDLSAWGANGNLTFHFRDAVSGKLSLFGEYLSGDDPSTEGKDEMFDILWGRYPRWSDAYVYSYVMETGGRIAQLNNLLRTGLSYSLAPTKQDAVSISCSLLTAPEATPTRALSPGLFTTTGHDRGRLLQLTLKHRFSSRLSGLFCAEYLTQGDFYTHRDAQSFYRVELSTKF